MNKLLFFSLVTAAVIFLLPALLSLGIRVIPGQVQPSLGATERIYSTTVVAEVFTATRDNLGGIGLSLKNPNLQNKQNVVISVFGEDGQFLGESIVNGASIPDGDFIKFLFKPIGNAAGKRFVFILSSVWSTEDNAVEAFYSNDPVKEKVKLPGEKVPCLSNTGDLKILLVDPNGMQNCTPLVVRNNHKADVSFAPFYKTANPYLIMKEIYIGWLNKFLADKAFSIIYLLLILGLLSGFVFLAKSKN